MNLNDAFSIVITYLINEATNEEYINKLNIILKGIKNKKHLEQFDHPKHQSLILFGHNIFIFTDRDYIQIAELIKEAT